MPQAIASNGLHVWPARHVHCRGVGREQAWDAMVGQPAAIVDARVAERALRRCRVAHAECPRAQTEGMDRVEKELVQFGGPLVVAPVPDPHEVAAPFDIRKGPEGSHVCRLVPRPRTFGPSAVQVEITDHAAEREDPVVLAQVVAAHLVRTRDRAVVGVVEEQPVATRGLVPTEPGHEQRVVPFVHEDEVGTVGHRLDRSFPRVVAGAAQLRERVEEVIHCRAAVIDHQVGAAPSVQGLEHLHVMTAGDQLGDDPSQEMGIPVIPVRHERVAEHDDLHDRTAERTWR
jgi:hypothetical protein